MAHFVSRFTVLTLLACGACGGGRVSGPAISENVMEVRHDVPLELHFQAHCDRSSMPIYWHKSGWRDLVGHIVREDDIRHYIQSTNRRPVILLDVIFEDNSALADVSSAIRSLYQIIQKEGRAGSRVVINIVADTFRGEPFETANEGT